MKTSLAGSLGRLSARERVLVGSLFGLVVLLIVGGGGMWIRSKLRAKEELIRKNRTAWVQIQKLSADYMRARNSQEELTEKLKSNPDALSPDSPVAQVAVRSKVRFRMSSGSEEESGMMNKVLQATGDARNKPMLAKRRKNQTGPQIYRVEKDFTMQRGFARMDDLFSFLDEVERMKGLVFIAKLHIERWSADPDFGQIKTLTASTLQYVDSAREE